MNTVGKVLNAMLQYYRGDVRRINHFLKVYGIASAIGQKENLGNKMQEILEITALTHDIGIKNSEMKHNSSAGFHQQIEGPPEAKKLLTDIIDEQDVIDRVCWLIAHHHTYTGIQGLDYQILVEADFLVNAFEENLSIKAIHKAREKLFKTQTGIELLENMYVVSCG